MTEEWRPVLGEEGRYEVSSLGRVRSLDRVTVDSKGRSRPFPGKVLTPQYCGNYPQLRLSYRQVNIHFLVAEAFHGPRPPGMQVRHLNGNGLDNRPENLAWGTPSENMYDKRIHGTDHEVNKTHCPHGHPYDEKNTYLDQGRRRCRTCINAAARVKQRNRRAARKAAA